MSNDPQCYLTAEAEAWGYLTHYLEAAGGNRAGIDSLRALTLMQEAVSAAVADHVQWARREGLSWAKIAEALGTSRQAAQQRYGR